MCTILSAIGNCYLLMKDYEKAKQFYESALQLIKPECEPVYHGIIGNMAIAEL